MRRKQSGRNGVSLALYAPPSAGSDPGGYDSPDRLNGSPGHSKISWNEVPGADGYLVQGSPDPITPTSWHMPQIAMKLACDANGATAGQKYWYRVAAFNGGGQGPWSPVTERPVM